MEQISRAKSFGGWVETYKHRSESTQTEMRFTIFRPPQAEKGNRPVLYWLSGLTCTDENFTVKAGAQRVAAEHGLILVMPDTSPRGAGVEGEDASYDLGTGAGFYVNATEAKWAKNYRMFDYVAKELPALLRGRFPIDFEREGIFGHSMGGHGALVLALRQPGRYRSVSAFAPICAPTECPWGEKAFTAYLGSDRKSWAEYDACQLIERSGGPPFRSPLLVDQGTDDKFLNDQLKPERLKQACAKAGQPLELRMQPGYDHSYFFIASFVGDHLAFHARYLGA
jgi:S-formylglutathione hydrolase